VATGHYSWINLCGCDIPWQVVARVFMHRRLPLLLLCLTDRTSSDGLENSRLKRSHCMRCLLKCWSAYHSQWISVMSVRPAKSQNWCSQSLPVV